MLLDIAGNSGRSDTLIFVSSGYTVHALMLVWVLTVMTSPLEFLGRGEQTQTQLKLKLYAER